jgi:uncharacterized protein VcgC/VcgE DUF2780
MRTLTLALIVTFSAGIAAAQENPPPAAQATTAAPAADQTASPDLVGQLVKDLGITPKQAEGAAGTLFGVAKGKLPAADFGKVAAAVPDMDALLKAAPAPDAKTSALDVIGAAAGGAGGVGSMAAAASTMAKLGLKPETIAKVAPALVKAVQAKGGAEVATLLASALK